MGSPSDAIGGKRFDVRIFGLQAFETLTGRLVVLKQSSQSKVEGKFSSMAERDGVGGEWDGGVASLSIWLIPLLKEPKSSKSRSSSGTGADDGGVAELVELGVGIGHESW